MQLDVFEGDKDIRRYDDRMVAACNDPTVDMPSDEIFAMRRQPINQQTFATAFALLSERFDREISQPLYKYYYRLLSSEMGEAEFKAAVTDAMKATLYWQNVIPFLVKHVREQRERGPDVWARDVTAMMRKAADEHS